MLEPQYKLNTKKKLKKKNKNKTEWNFICNATESLIKRLTNSGNRSIISHSSAFGLRALTATAYNRRRNGHQTLFSHFLIISPSPYNFRGDSIRLVVVWMAKRLFIKHPKTENYLSPYWNCLPKWFQFKIIMNIKFINMYGYKRPHRHTHTS